MAFPTRIKPRASLSRPCGSRCIPSPTPGREGAASRACGVHDVHRCHPSTRRHVARQRAIFWTRTSPRSGTSLRVVVRAVGVAPYQPRVQVVYNTAWVLWNAVDILASVGAVASGIAFVMTQDRRLLYLPVVLPLVANYAAKRREASLIEGVLTEVLEGSAAGRAAVAAAAAREAKFMELAGAMQRAAAEASSALSSSSSAVARLDSRLSALESSIVSAGQGLKGACKEVDEVAARLAKAGSAQAAELASAVRRGVASEVREAMAEPLALSQQLASQMQAVEETLAQMEAQFSNALQGLSREVTTFLEDAEVALQTAVRNETARSLETVTRLPQALAAALPVTDVTAVTRGPTRDEPARFPEEARAWLRVELDRVVSLLSRAQAEEIRAELDPRQWTVLGNRLALIEEGLREATVAVQSAKTEPLLLGLREDVRKGLDDVLNRLPDLNRQRDYVQALEGSMQDVNQRLQLVQEQLQAGGREDSTATSPGLDLQTLELALKPLQEALEALRSLEVSRAEGRPLQVAALSQDELQAGPVDAALLSAAQDGLIRQLEENQDKLQRALVEFQSSLNRQLDRAAARVEAALERSDQLGRELSGSSMKAEGAEEKPREELLEGDKEVSSSDRAPKGYKGDPSDSQEVAFRRMQALLASRAATATPPAGDQPAPAISSAASDNNTEALAPAGGAAGLVPQSPAPVAPATVEGPAALTPAQAQERRENLAAKAFTQAVITSEGRDNPLAEPIAAWLESRFPEARDAGPEPSAPAPPRQTTPNKPKQATPSEDVLLVALGGDLRPGQADDVRPGEYSELAWLPDEDRSLEGPWVLSQPRTSLQGSALDQTGAGSGQATTAGGQATSRGTVFRSDPDSFAAGRAAPQGLSGGGEPRALVPRSEGTAQALLAEGKALMREGRAARLAGDYAAAEAGLQQALAAFQEAAMSLPDSISLLGNWGNTLQEVGKLKADQLEAMMGTPPPSSPAAEAAEAKLEARLREEAEAALVEAGTRYRAIAERDPTDSRALWNWGKAMFARAKLAMDAGVARRLYGSAAAKLEAVLKAEPDNVPAQRTLGLTLHALGTLQPGSRTPQDRAYLQEAAWYLAPIVESNSGDQEAANALRQIDVLLPSFPDPEAVDDPSWEANGMRYQ